MKYKSTVKLKDGHRAILRNATEKDAQEVINLYNSTHSETDYLLVYPDERTTDAKYEAFYIKNKLNSPNEAYILAVVDGHIVGEVQFTVVANCFKARHRADLSLTVLKSYWGLGIGSELLKACIDCARKAKYTQLELSVISDNQAAISLYKKFGFIEYGRNPKGCFSRTNKYQEIVYMLLEL